MTIEKERELEDRRKTAKVRELEGRVQGLMALRDELIKKNDEYVRKIQDEDRKYRQKLTHLQQDHVKYQQDFNSLKNSLARQNQDNSQLQKDFTGRETQQYREENEIEGLVDHVNQIRDIGERDIKH